MLLGSLALAHRIEDTPWKAVGEVWGAQPVRATANYTQLDLTAIEFLLGAKYIENPALEWQFGFTRGTRGGISTPDYRLYLGMNWQFGNEPDPVPETPVVVEAPPPPAPTPVAVMAPAVGNFVISNINFKTNSAEVSPEYTAYLKKFADFVKAKASYKSVTVKGFTDSTGTKPYNLVLSQKRAEAIKKVLVENEKIPSEKVQTIGFGVENPVATNKTADGRRLNRRIELLVQE